MHMDTEQFAEDMVRGKTEECWDKLLQHVDSGRNSLFIFEQLLAPAMRYVGSLWEHNLITVADEHLASGVCEVLLTRYAALKKPSTNNGYRAMLLCVKDEAHYFGLKMVSTIFEEHGFDTRFYGQNLPLEYARLSALNWKPDIIALSVSIAYHLPTLLEYIEAFEQLVHRPVIMIGGRIIEKYSIQEAVADRAVFLSDMLELDKWIMSYSRQVNQQQYVR
ncbi:cobalamin-dependent protein [Neobacillus mesonae]|nr:cobalamin-dependent protein [Neobacillus mesonae]